MLERLNPEWWFDELVSRGWEHRKAKLFSHYFGLVCVQSMACPPRASRPYSRRGTCIESLREIGTAMALENVRNVAHIATMPQLHHCC